MNDRVSIYLEPKMRRSAEAGEHNFIRKVETVLRQAGAEISFLDEAERSWHGAGRALIHMKAPMNEETLVFRRVYAYPFWAIEASDKRWEWDVARAQFAPEGIAAHKAKRFVENWRTRMFGDLTPKDGGFVYMPLQGRISEHRSFQSMSPLDMIDAVLTSEPQRQIVIGLHPKEQYGESDLKALEKIERQHSSITIVMGQMERYLPNCDYVVTQNSAVAFFGYFFAKPAALFAQIDFHHIAANVFDLGANEALRLVSEMRPAFDQYLWWFWQERSINAGRPEAEERIKARLAQLGWL